jgi:N-acyl-D-amino-acid deacylase
MRKLEQRKDGELLTNPAEARPPEVSMEEQCRAILEIFKAGNAQCVFHTMNDEEVENIMRNPLVAIASDSGLREFNVGVPHPRGYGTNTRVLGRYAREKKLFSMEEAVRRMTSLPAATFRFADRGLLKPGNVADVVIFDPATVVDKATFDQPHQYPEGLTDVIVNGVPVLREGRITGKLPGRAVMGAGHTKEQLPK